MGRSALGVRMGMAWAIGNSPSVGMIGKRIGYEQAMA